MIPHDKQAQITLTKVLVGVTIVAMVLLAVFAFLREQTTNSGNPDVVNTFERQFENSTGNLQNMTALADDVRGTLQTQNLISVEGLSALFTGSYSVLRIILNAMALPINILVEFSNAIGMPDWFLPGLIVILVIVVGLLILAAILGRQGV